MTQLHSEIDETQPMLAHTTKSKSKKLLVFIVCAVFLLSADFGFFMSTAPQLAVFEDIICRDYKATLHRTGDVLTPSLSGPNPCKSEAVQGELALVIGYKNTLEVLPGMAYGWRLRSREYPLTIALDRPSALTPIWCSFRSLWTKAPLLPCHVRNSPW